MGFAYTKYMFIAVLPNPITSSKWFQDKPTISVLNKKDLRKEIC